ncbi:hypothetical protein [Metapseudomonas otitidis]|uniref:hypothetical protein n=1 Tax=Metapseudomonas otitidis TaxID=319939 RepID=UPI001CA410B5|nr:hypothetical protein [Pseudomonas otitidis]QZX85322.1 hypothetical protein K6751_11670 [Pseudomonas otitidis]
MNKRDVEALRAARWKRERRAERNIRNEYRQGRGPEGLELAKDGWWIACCRRCEQPYEWPAMAVDYTDDGNYCGRSDRCMP